VPCWPATGYHAQAVKAASKELSVSIASCTGHLLERYNASAMQQLSSWSKSQAGFACDCILGKAQVSQDRCTSLSTAARSAVGRREKRPTCLNICEPILKEHNLVFSGPHVRVLQELHAVAALRIAGQRQVLGLQLRARRQQAVGLAHQPRQLVHRLGTQRLPPIYAPHKLRAARGAELVGVTNRAWNTLHKAGVSRTSRWETWSNRS